MVDLRAANEPRAALEWEVALKGARRERCDLAATELGVPMPAWLLVVRQSTVCARQHIDLAFKGCRYPMGVGRWEHVDHLIACDVICATTAARGVTYGCWPAMAHPQCE